MVIIRVKESHAASFPNMANQLTLTELRYICTYIRTFIAGAHLKRHLFDCKLACLLSLLSFSSKSQRARVARPLVTDGLS